MSDSNSNQAQKANLARIRDNQRRSRARRKEYLQELETKYRTCEAIGVEASAEIQAAARRVLEENRRLRLLLKQQGLTDAEIDGFTPTAISSPGIDKSEFSDNPQFPVPSNSLVQLLTTRRQCKPESGCGSSGSCNEEPLPRGQSCISDEPSQQSQTPALLPIQIQIQPQPQPQTQHQAQPLPQHQQHHQQQQQQHASIRATPQPIIHARPASIVSISPVHEQFSVQSTPSNQHDYPIYDTQPHPAYMYPIPLEAMAQWNAMPTPQHLHQTMAPQQQQAFVATSGPPSHSIHPEPVVYNTTQVDPPNSTSCYVAANAIRSYSANAGPEVEQALGCRDGVECHVNNDVVFEIMDRYAGAANDRVG